MANTRMYRANVTLCLARPEAFADRTAPTAAELHGALVYNITCALNEDGTSGEFNEALDLMAFPDIEYIAIMRVGGISTDAFAATNRIKMVGVKTDWGIDVLASGENVRLSQTFFANDFVNWNYEVAA